MTGNMLGYFFLMWTPALAALVARLVWREGVADISFRIGGRRGWVAMLAALLFPIVVGLIAYGSAWATGLAGFVEPTGMFAALGRRIIGAQTSSSALVFMATLLVVSTVGTLVSAISAAARSSVGAGTC